MTDNTGATITITPADWSQEISGPIRDATGEVWHFTKASAPSGIRLNLTSIQVRHADGTIEEIDPASFAPTD